MEIKRNNTFNFNLDDLDSSQRVAVEGQEEKIVIKAPAGSGKTKSLISAIANYRYEHLNDRICAITYTRAARAEMEARLQQMGVFDVEVTTIHVWARTLLQDLAIKYDFKINILQEAQIKEILRELVKKYLIKSKVRSINIDILYSYITSNKNMDITDNYKRTLNALEERYIQYKRANNLYDFTDYPLYLFHVLVAFNESINNIDALFVDEFQDVDEIQLELFRMVNASKKFFIGDPRQSIFVFRGADGEVFQKIDTFKRYKLGYNYRSYQEIIDYATEVYDGLERDVEEGEVSFISMIIPELEQSDIDCVRGYGGKVTVVSPFGEVYEMTKDKVVMHNDVKGVVNEFLEKNPMILCRTNKQVKSIQQNTIYSAETVHQAKGLEYQDVIVIDSGIKTLEDLNIAYVALTRAKDSVLVINWAQFETMALGGVKW